MPPPIISLINQKGGVGKTTTAVNVASILAETYRVLLIDADENGTTRSHMERAEDGAFPPALEYLPTTDPAELDRMRETDDVDVIIVDTPGTRDSVALQVIVKRASFVIMPTAPSVYDVHGLAQTIHRVIIPTGVPFRVLIVRTHVQRLARAAEVREECITRGWPVFDTMIRELVAHLEAQAIGVPAIAYRGAGARDAADDYRRLTAEIVREWPIRPGGN